MYTKIKSEINNLCIFNFYLGMPSAKQKLKSTLFSVLKDQHSLAYYNMINGLLLELSAKERGGKIRKK